jgi:IS5 family transposase
LLDFELFREDLEKSVPRKPRDKGGRPAFDHVLMLKILLLQTYHDLSDKRTEFLLKDRLTFMRFLGQARSFGLSDRVSDANTIWLFREALTKAGAIDRLFRRFDQTLRQVGYLAMGGQLMDVSIVLAPRQRMKQEEKAIIKVGGIPEDWKRHPSKLAQKDRDARWMVRQGRKLQKEGKGSQNIMIAIPYFGYKSHLSTDRRHGLIRRWMVSHAASYDGDKLLHLLDKKNTANSVWADTTYRSAKNEMGTRDRQKMEGEFNTLRMQTDSAMKGTETKMDGYKSHIEKGTKIRKRLLTRERNREFLCPLLKRHPCSGTLARKS